MKKHKPYGKIKTQRAYRKILAVVSLSALICVSSVYFAFWYETKDAQAQVNWVKQEPEYKEITNENKNGHRYLTAEEKEWVLNTCEQAGFKRQDVKCLIEHESSWDENGWLTNWDNMKGTDRGLFAINSLFHKEVSHKCAFDYQCSTREFIRIAKANGSLNAWHGYTKNCK